MKISENNLVKVLREIIWPIKVICPECKSNNIYHVKNKDNNIIKKYTCRKCLCRFSDISHTIFYKTRIPLKTWYEAFIMHQSNPKITNRKIKNKLKISYTTASRIMKIIKENQGFVDKILSATKQSKTQHPKNTLFKVVFFDNSILSIYFI